MTTISRRLGGSKGTLYGYFRSKAELFEAAMKAAVETPGDRIMELLDPEADDLRSCLERFAKAYLGFILEKNVLAITRTAVAEGFDSSLGPHLFEQGPQRALATLAKFFAEQMERGRLCKSSAVVASIHFKGLIEAGFLEEALYGAKSQVDRRQAIPSAVDIFLRAYGPGTQEQLIAEPASSKTERRQVPADRSRER